jgi:hypothetical protein
LPQRDTRRRRRPVERDAARHVPAADREVGAVLDDGHQRRQHGRVVRQVGVHLHADLRALLDRVSEAGPVGGAQAGLAVAADDLDLPSRSPSAAARSAVPSGLPSSTTRISAHRAAPHGRARTP